MVIHSNLEGTASQVYLYLAPAVSNLEMLMSSGVFSRNFELALALAETDVLRNRSQKPCDTDS
jgi:hypothetical protein